MTLQELSVEYRAHARALDGQGRALFALEARCTDLYDLCLDAVPTPGREWTTGPVIFPAP